MFSAGRPRFASVVSVLALVVALCGGAYAAGLAKNSVGPKQLKKGAVKTKKLADGAVTSPKVADGSLGANDLAPGVIPAGDSYTKAESDGRYYTKGESDSRYLSATGATALHASPLDWRSTNPAFTGQIQYDTAGISLSSGQADNASIAIAPTLPLELAGKPQRLIGVNACYNTTNLTTLTQVSVNRVETTGGTTSTSFPLVDPTDRDDAACRDYILPEPLTLDATTSAVLQFSIVFAGGGGNSFSASRATFMLAP